MSGAGETILEAQSIHRSFRIGQKRLEVLRGISLKVERGETVFLCGASGAGKTTLLYTMAGMERPEEGEVLFQGEPVYGRGESFRARLRGSRMGFVFQGYFLLPELTAWENVALPGMVKGGYDEKRIGELLERVGLGGRLDHLPNELSGGEQQRVAIARALMNDPAVVFADEPTGNLDSVTGGEIMDLLLSLVDERGKTLLVVTHDPELARRGDRLLHIRDGSLVGED